MTNLYPFLFRPNLHSVLWGGNRLCTYKGIKESQDAIGESWEVSAVPASTNIIANGALAGMDLITAINQSPVEILGEAVNTQYHGQLPLLAKFIDAKRDLSVQVHPNDKMAQRLHGKMGKSEMWYIIDATPGSYLYAGFKKQITPEEYKKCIDNGTIIDVLAKHEVKTGDVFYLPAGRVHAIGGGILLAEIQQSSDVTYRIYDYNRPGKDGKPRELHTDLAAQALDYRVENEYRTLYTNGTNRANLVIDSPYFTVRVIETEKTFHRNLIKYDSFIICMCLEDVILLKHGNSCLVPAAIADFDIEPLNGKTRILDAFIDNKDRNIAKQITRFLHIS